MPVRWRRWVCSRARWPRSSACSRRSARISAWCRCFHTRRRAWRRRAELPCGRHRGEGCGAGAARQHRLRLRSGQRRPGRSRAPLSTCAAPLKSMRQSAPAPRRRARDRRARRRTGARRGAVDAGQRARNGGPGQLDPTRSARRPGSASASRSLGVQANAVHPTPTAPQVIAPMSPVERLAKCTSRICRSAAIHRMK